MHHVLARVLLFACLSGASLATRMRWCCTPGEERKCEDFTEALTTCARKLSIAVNATCVVAKDRAECVEMIMSKTADLVTIGRKEIVTARKSAKLVLVLAEDYGLGKGVKYYGVAVAKKGTQFGIRDLKGKKSCHTGAGRTAGWDIPIGFLLSKRIMPRKGSCSPYVAAANFFSAACVPGARSSKFDPQGENPENLCEICGGTGENKCSYESDKEPYAGHTGALKCLTDGKGDVAFFKHGTVKDNVSDYEYLCPDGTRKEIGDAANCNLGTSAPQPVITWSGNSDREAYTKLLLAASNNTCGFQMFNSTKYGGEDLLFRDSTKELTDFGGQSPLNEWLESQYREDLDAMHDCREPTLTPILSLATRPSHWFGVTALFWFLFYMAISE